MRTMLKKRKMKESRRVLEAEQKSEDCDSLRHIAH